MVRGEAIDEGRDEGKGKALGNDNDLIKNLFQQVVCQ